MQYIGEGAYLLFLTLFEAAKKVDVLLMVSFAFISCIAFIITMYVGRGQSCRSWKKREIKYIHYLNDILSFFAIWSSLIFFGCLIGGTIALFSAFVVRFIIGAWPYWWSLSYVLAFLGGVSIGVGLFLFTMSNQFLARYGDEEDKLYLENLP